MSHPASNGLTATGADLANIVQNTYNKTAEYQHQRELAVNAFQAGAKNYEVDFVDAEDGRHLMFVADDGCGMDKNKLLSFARLGCTDKDGNYGIGAKVTTLPWNKNGVVVISYRDGVGLVLWLRWDSRAKSYVSEFKDADGNTDVRSPKDIVIEGIELAKLAPKWVAKAHGTVVLLLGDGRTDTWRGDSRRGENGEWGLVQYFNVHFKDLTTLNVKVARMTANERVKQASPRVKGVFHYVQAESNTKEGRGHLAQRATLSIDEGRVDVEVLLRQGAATGAKMSVDAKPFIGIEYENEFYERARFNHAAMYGRFGIIHESLKSHLYIFLKPRKQERGWGVSPDQDRKGLIFEKGYRQSEMPIDDWAAEFRENMPQFLKDAIAELNSAEVINADDALDEQAEKLLGKFSGFNRAFDRATSAVLDERRLAKVNDGSGEVTGDLTGDIIATSPPERDDTVVVETEGGDGDPAPVFNREETTPSTARGPKNSVPVQLPEVCVSHLPQVIPMRGTYEEFPLAPAVYNDETKQVAVYFGSHLYRSHLAALQERYKSAGDVLSEFEKSAETTWTNLIRFKVYHIKKLAENGMVGDKRQAAALKSRMMALLTPEALTTAMSGMLAEHEYIVAHKPRLGVGRQPAAS